MDAIGIYRNADMEIDEVNEMLRFIAKTGTIYNNSSWTNIKVILAEKIKNIEKEFADSVIEEIPQYPNVDSFNFDRMKASLLERLELFSAPPFTIQRMCELLADPKKQYSRIDKFMRALEKNILVVSTMNDNGRRQSENEVRENMDHIMNGTDSESTELNIETDAGTETCSNEKYEEKSTDNTEETNSKESTHRLEDDDGCPSPKKMKFDKDVDVTECYEDKIENIDMEEKVELKEDDASTVYKETEVAEERITEEDTNIKEAENIDTNLIPDSEDSQQPEQLEVKEESPKLEKELDDSEKENKIDEEKDQNVPKEDQEKLEVESDTPSGSDIQIQPLETESIVDSATEGNVKEEEEVSVSSETVENEN